MSSEFEISPEMKQPVAVLPPAQNRSSEIAENLNVPSGILKQMQEQAQKYPRDISLVMKNASAELSIVPGLAARSYYSIPYNQGKSNETRVEGPSIKAAMTLLRNWGNAIDGGRVSSEDKSNFYCEGMFFDLQTNRFSMRPIRVSKFYKPKGSQGLVPRDGDLLYNAVQAGISKAIRNVILANLPDWLVQQYFNAAKQIVLNPPKEMGKIVKSIQERVMDGKNAIMKKFGVTSEEMELYLTDNADSIEDDAALLIHLQGLFNSLKDGEYSVDKVFRPNQKSKGDIIMPQERPVKNDIPS
jgi:hypothetical protein